MNYWDKLFVEIYDKSDKKQTKRKNEEKHEEVRKKLSIMNKTLYQLVFLPERKQSQRIKIVF